MSLSPPLPKRSLDSVTTINSDGSRPFLHPASVKGRFTRARTISGWLLIALYLSLPWIKIGGYPAVFLDVAHRRFHLFGLTLATQDLWLLFFLITGLGFSLFFITALFGRIWCGWACPQTVFLDHVYRRIERFIEGDAVQRRALAAAPLSAAKIFKRTAKHTLYLAVSAVITHLFLAYYVSLPEVWAMVSAAPAEHWSAFAFVTVATGVLYFNFAWFREQLCIVICPYGRLQSALIDDHSLVIGYDATRGEPRGRCRTGSPDPAAFESAPRTAGSGDPALQQQQMSRGDCVDCARCVQVCPTGIDIRQGLQLECIGCTACIDACDDVMTRLRRPRGLIRYDSQNGFAGRRTRWLRPRTVLYGVLLFAGASVATWALSTVRPANLAVTRMTGAPYYVDAESVRNQFLVRLVNKRTEPTAFVVSIAGAPDSARQSGLNEVVTVPALGEEVRPLVLQMPRHGYTGGFRFEIHVRGDEQNFELKRSAEFIGPDPQLLREAEEKK